MNCIYCGRKLYPDAPFCPHCGRPNTQQITLDKKEHEFEKEYEQTTEQVKTAVKRKNRFLLQITAIVFLVVGIGVSVILHAYAGVIARDRMEKRITENVGEVTATVDTYLAEQDYFGLRSYLRDRYTLSHLDSAAPSYHAVGQTVINYCDLVEVLMQYCDQARKLKGYSRTEFLNSSCRSIRRLLEEFYKYADPENSSWSGKQEHLSDIAQMEKNVEVMVGAVFHLPVESVAAWPALSAGERGVLLEQVIIPVEEP